MDYSKVIITRQRKILKQYSFENEVGLSSYDLALISINKNSIKRKACLNDSSTATYLI